MKRKVYLETTIASYLTARPSRDLVVAAHQKLTMEWWTIQRHRFNLFVSDLVLQEASRGDALAAENRLDSMNLNSAVGEELLCLRGTNNNRGLTSVSRAEASAT